jgi:ATP-dependent RNA helicase HelY
VFNPNRAEYRRDVARALGNAKLRGGERDERRHRSDGSGSYHAVETDPELRQRMRAAGQAERLERELAELTARVDGHNQSLAREFDRVLDVLDRRGYVDADGWALTADGTVLARVFHEADLLVAECLLHGLLDGLGAAELAGLLSVFVYEHRSPEPAPPPWFPSTDVRDRWRRLVATSEDLAADERSTGLGEHRPPDPGFVAAAHAWVLGEDLADVVADELLTGGDFVRTMKQLIDLARQVALIAPEAATRRRAREAADRAFRGVVADGVVARPAAPVTEAGAGPGG